MEIKLQTCLLRRWRRGDEQSLVYHANNRKVWINLLDGFPFPYTPADAQHWVHHVSRESPVRNFAIEVDGNAVGSIGIHPKRDVYRKSAGIGYWLGEEFWGRGIATESVRAMIDYSFSHFDLCRLYAGVFEWNGASMRVLEKAGFSFEARMRKSVTKDGKTIDEYIYAIVRP
ncbi:MAG TPA: GNAT family N-acetyltransferase [Bacteroidota bacterium]|nr:GNAT family N-acetyltransferase [Bacteroidota bacterium]